MGSRDVGGDEAVSTFTPQPFHMAGPTNVLNGGIIGTVIDCHCICTAFADAYRREGFRQVNSASRRERVHM